MQAVFHLGHLFMTGALVPAFEPSLKVVVLAIHFQLPFVLQITYLLMPYHVLTISIWPKLLSSIIYLKDHQPKSWHVSPHHQTQWCSIPKASLFAQSIWVLRLFFKVLLMLLEVSHSLHLAQGKSTCGSHQLLSVVVNLFHLTGVPC